MRIEGAGTIEKRGRNLWRVRFNLGADPLTGEYRRTPWRTVHGTKADAQAALAGYRQEVESGLKLDADKLTFGEFADLWCEQRRLQGTLAPGTLRDAEYSLKHLTRHIADIPIRDLDTVTITALLSELGADGLSQQAIKRSYRILKQVLKAALMQGLILTNPCDRVPSPKAQRAKIEFLDSSQAIRLMAALDAAESEAAKIGKEHRKTAPRRVHRFEKCAVRHCHKLAQVMAVRIALATGARRGEVMGLTWGCVDIEAQSIRIAQQLTNDGIRHPKTERGKRMVSIGPDLAARLQRYKVIQAEYLLRLGIAQEPASPVGCDEAGGWHNPANFPRWWREFTTAYGFEGLRFHDLRHTQATLLIAQGVDIKSVQARLGHTLASTTLDLYAGVIPAKDKEAAGIIDAILTAEPEQKNKVISL